MIHDPNNYYELETGMIVCGECLDEALQDTRLGKFTGDEGVEEGMFTRLEDDRVEAYQCDNCLKQNPPYEDLDLSY